MVRFLLTSLFVLATTIPAVAQTDDATADLVGSTATTVEVDPTAQSVAVTHEYRFVNSTGDVAFPGFFETLPWDATDVVATAVGLDLEAVGTPARDGFSEWFVLFPTPLAPGQALDVVITWQRQSLDSDPNDLDHVSRDVVAVAPFAPEHRGDTSLRVVVAGVFDVVDAAGFVVERDDDGVMLRADDVEGYVARPVVLEAPDRFTRAPLPTADVDITLATANGASTWMADDLVSVVDGLTAVIPLAPPPAIEFRQGYTGGDPVRIAGDGAVVLPFQAGAPEAARILTEAWLAPVEVTDPDLWMAFSAALADHASADAGLRPPFRSGPWSAAIDALVSVSDDSTLSTVVAALEAGVPAYAGVDDEFSDAPIDWRRFLDVFEHVGGVQAAPAAMRLSASADQVAELDRRSAALADYNALAARAAPWAMPPMLREPMAAWDFDLMRDRQGTVSDLILARDEMIAAAESVELGIGPYVQVEFERAAVDADGAWELLVEQREALDHVAEALRLDVGDRGLLSSLGMAGRDADATLARIVADWDAGDFETASHDAEELIEDYEASVGRGTLRLVVPLAALAALLIAGQTLLNRRRAAQASVEP